MNRNTRQNNAIRKAIVDTRRPLSPTEIFELAREEIPGLGIATVYRAIKRLVEQREAIVVELPGTSSRYESAEAAAVHHHHFHCNDCDRVFDVPGCPVNLVALTPPGFCLNAHELVLYGRCAECGDAGRL